ncbi:MAG: hypothetical protein ACPLXL_00455 [Minisyncoccia bacterium]
MDFSSILSHSFQFYKEKIKEILLFGFIFFLNWYLISVYISPVFSSFSLFNKNPSIIFGYFFTFLWILLTSSLFELLILNLVKLPNSSLKEIFLESFGKVFSYFFFKILIGLIIFLGLLALIVPAIILAIYLFFAIYAFVDEDLTIGQSLKESWRLVKGKWWTIFGTLLLLSLFVFLISLVLGLIIYFIDKSCCNVKIFGNSQLKFSSLISILFNFVFLTPFNLIFCYHFYFFIKKQKDQKEEVELELTQ